MNSKYLMFIAIIFFGTFASGLCNNLTNTFRIISRNEWGAELPRLPPIELKVYPAPFVIITHTLTEHCSNERTCGKLIRGIQDMHMLQIGWNDIAHNFLVGGDGNIYEGRGWNVEGAHTRKFNHRSIAIAFMGDYSETPATQQQLDVVKNFIQYSAQAGKIASNYKLVCQRQAEFTRNPGDILYEIIKTWDHFVPGLVY
ncbi:PREDICTED: peptidoglycan-recognition protein 2-like [Ceratosolen solmsi marchali]|uniref:Peptidoglycan-recognition protein n=1 Tax=Ceratosolen solmsi marchali TaxID=326594 RepID=A0AAJ6VM06_9HYME|nr:PREDICTED: peptidoglycan-recognition protein 2-like [Ceratosolen solmsi marchali]